MTLQRVLYAEILKLKNTITLKIVVLAPIAICLLVFFLVSQTPFSSINRFGTQNAWPLLLQFDLHVWALLMLPLLIALVSARVAGVDHSENQWRSLLARPVPRWTFYVAKLIVLSTLTVMSSVVLLFGIMASGAVLPHIQPDLTFGPPRWNFLLVEWGYFTGLIFLALTIQHWVSLRWRSFSVPLGMGIIATVIGFIVVSETSQIGATWLAYFPWSLPMMVVAKNHPNLNVLLGVDVALGLAVGAAGCLDFCNLEVQ